MGDREPKNLKPEAASEQPLLMQPIKGGVGTSQLAPPWSRSQVNWVGKGYFVLRLATEGMSRWLLGAAFDGNRVYPHERTFRRLAVHKSTILRSLKMNPWPVHLAGDFDAEMWRNRLSALVEGKTPLVDTGYVSLWWETSIPRELQLSVQKIMALDGHHSRRAQRLLGSSRIFGWLESLNSPELKVKALHRSGQITGWLNEFIKQGELRVLTKPVDAGSWTMDRSLAFEVVQADKRFWCEVARPQKLGEFYETCIDALGRLVGQRRVFLRTSPNFDEVMGWLERMEIDTGLRLPAPTKPLVWKRAMAGQLFPQKATSFFPKIPFGLIVEDLR